MSASNRNDVTHASLPNEKELGQMLESDYLHTVADNRPLIAIGAFATFIVLLFLLLMFFPEPFLKAFHLVKYD